MALNGVVCLLTLSCLLTEEVMASITVSNAPWVDIGSDTRLNCTTTFTGMIREVRWARGEATDTINDISTIVLIIFGQSIEWSSAVDMTHFTFDETVPGVPLTVKSVTIGDEGRYWCLMNVVGVGEVYDTSDLQIRVPPTTMTVAYLGNSYSDGDSIPVVAGDDRQFTCNVSGIKPAATFTWTLDGATLTDSGTRGDYVNKGDPRLVDSSDTEAVIIAESPGTLMLYCGATNHQDGLTDVEVTVTVQVKVPPRTSSMMLLDSTGSNVPDRVSVDQGIEYTIMCVVRGTRPSATITWLLNEQVQRMDDPDPSVGDELVDTTSEWSFIPSRDDHDSVVKCSASTAETEGSAPAVSVTLKVNVPPDAPLISGTALMRENVPVELTCNAENGYPNDWTLAWVNDDTPLPNNPDTTPTSSGTRFRFSSTLTFTPSRQDNGGNIICKAERGAFSSAEGTFGPLDVQFCTTSTRIKQCPLKIQQGSQLVLICSSGSGNPEASISWLKNGEVETNDQGMSSVTDGDFNGKVTEQTYLQQFTNKADNGATFQCCAAGPPPCADQGVCSEPCTLNVEYPPEFLRQATRDVVVTEGWDVVLSCSADANPKPPDFITWERVGSSETLPSMYSDGMSNVTLAGISRDQSGPYRCRGNNGIPPVEFSSEVVVKVQYEVFFIDKEDLIVGAKDGATALLRCTAMGNPQPSTQWRSETHGEITNQTIPGKLTVTHTTISEDDVNGYSVASTLEITEVVGTSDYGEYTCQSGNGIGMVVSLNIKLNDRVLPQPPTGVTIDRGQITATSMKVTWTPGNDGGETQWFHVNHRKVTTSVSFDPDKLSKRIDGTAEYLLERLSPFSLYEIEVYAGNGNGISKSVKRNATTLPLSPAEMGIGVTLRQETGMISLEKIPQNDDGCLKLEFRLTEQDEWYNYGGCQMTNTELMLEEVRSRFCQDSLCSEPSQADVDTTRGDLGLLVGVIILILVLVVVVVVFLVFLFRRRRIDRRDTQSLVSKQKRNPEMVYQELDIPMQVVSAPPLAKRPEPVPTYDEVPEVEIATAVPRDRVNITKPLGEGAFGRVLLGRVRSIVRRGEVTDVAIKTLKDGAGPTQKDDLLRELDLMKSLPAHNNVVKLLGFCIETEPIYIIVELLSKGNLKDLLTESRGKGKAKLQIYGNLHGTSKNLTSRDLIAMGRDVADGMAFLSEQKCIHRDLAARNILVSKGMVCKVADFGLARDIKNERVYHRKSETPLPIRWMALESVFDDWYGTESDIWSFGVLLWEIVTLGARPYPSMSAKTVVTQIRNGYRMPRPEHCQDELYQMMLNCWSEDPDDRFPFQKLSTKLGKLLETASDYICITDYQETLYEVTVPSTPDEKT